MSQTCHKIQDFFVNRAESLIKINMGLESLGVLIYITITSVGLITNLNNEDNTKQEENMLLENSIFVISSQFIFMTATVYFGFHSFFKHNVLELYLFIVLSAVSSFCAIVGSIRCIYDEFCDMQIWLSWLISLMIIINQLFFFALVFLVTKNMYYLLFKKMASAAMIELYKPYEAFKASLKATFIVATCQFIGLCIFMKNKRYWELSTLVVTYFIFVFSVVRSYLAVKKELKLYIRFYLAYSIFFLIVRVFLMFDVCFYSNKSSSIGGLNMGDIHMSEVTQVILVFLEILDFTIFLILIYLGIKCMNNFDKGLKEFLEEINKKRKNPNVEMFNRSKTQTLEAEDSNIDQTNTTAQYSAGLVLYKKNQIKKKYLCFSFGQILFSFVFQNLFWY